MDVKEFFYNGGVVKCKDHTESDVVVQIALAAGIPRFRYHDSRGDFHGVCVNGSTGRLDFYPIGCDAWCEGTPFVEWMVQYGFAIRPTPVEDLI